MTFDYKVYRLQNCHSPLSGVIVFTLFLALIVSEWIRYKNHPSMTVERKFALIFFFVAFVYVVIINIIPLVRGGIYLLFEKEDDAVSISGIVEEKGELDDYSGGIYTRYGVNANRGRGEFLVVNGRKYYMMTYGNVKIGDNVIMKVLPKSGFVLSLDYESEDMNFDP